VIKLSVLIPIYNEERELAACLKQVLASPVAYEFIAVDDCSTDRTPEILKQYSDPRLKIFRHEKNRGKGGAIKSALEHASGDYVIIQDADTEYDPADYARLLDAVEKGRAHVVYGSRDADLRKQPLVGYLGNRFLTEVANWLLGTRLMDMETCYKLVPTELMRELKIESRGFEVEPEITAKIAKRNIKIFEVPVSYAPRQDKKLRRFRDGSRSLVALFRYKFRN
jgi:glycosyltransferase involved in cell wall biosynthesis